jgi:hypothetical protein
MSYSKDHWRLCGNKMTISDSLREHSGHHVGDDFRLMRDAADEIERLREALNDLRQRSVEEGIHHFVKLIDVTLAK